jgi:hypothetical protein
MNGTLRARKVHREPETLADRHWEMIHRREKQRRHPYHPVLGRI